MEYIPRILESVRVVDLSADYRIASLETYREWYGEHTSPALLERAVYGLCEVYREEIGGFARCESRLLPDQHPASSHPAPEGGPHRG